MPASCPSCGYDLTGVDGPCPECGQEWTSTQFWRLEHARHVALLFKITAGGGALVAALGAFVIWAARNRITGEPWLLVIAGCAVSAISLTLAWRVKLAAKSREPQHWLEGRGGIAAGVGCLLATLVLAAIGCLVAFVVYVVLVKGVNP